MITRRAKIVCTLGPSSSSYEEIKRLTQAGMDVARLNFSHGTHENHAALIAEIRRVARDTGKAIGILQDLQGPKIRVKNFKGGYTQLDDNQVFTLTTRDVEGTSAIASVSYPEFHKDVKKGDYVLLDDGLIKLQVEEINGTNVRCRVIFGGILRDHKGLNLPGSILSVEALTDKDKDDLAFGLKNGVDFVALSFVQKPDDIRFIKEIISKAGKDTPVIAKIEKPQAVQTIDQITEIADVIMVARGDLGVELSAEEVPPVQKQIIALCNRKGVPVITATQMLESMISNPRPTRAEASDVANAILDGTDAVMLSAETASGQYPVAAVEVMNRIILLAERDIGPRWDLRRQRGAGNAGTALTIGYSACHAADLIEGGTIICLTQSGSTARMISRFRPVDPILALTHADDSLHRMSLLWGVQAFRTREFGDNLDDVIEDGLKILREKGLVQKGDRVIITAGVPFTQRRATNMLRIEEI
jgi:pyruvate kinase